MILRNATKHTIPYFFLAILLVAFSPSSASALTISPARIEISGDAGSTISKPITLFNDNKTQSQTYYISFANFEAQGESGSPKFVEPKNDLGTWMSTGSDSVTVPPGGSKDVMLTINVPQDAYAGGHFSVVFFGTSSPKDGGQVSVGAKTGTLVLLSVNGDVLEAGGLAGFKTKNNKRFYNTLPVSFEYRFKNDGNDRVKPSGNIVIHNTVYFPTEKINANAVSGNILPHSTRLFEVDWIKKPLDINVIPPTGLISSFFDKVSFQWNNFALGPYVATLDLVYGTQSIQTSESTFFFVFPWQLMICILFVLLIVSFFGKKLLKKYNNYIIKKARAGMNLHDAKHE